MTGKFPFPERDKARLNQVLLPDIIKKEVKPMDVFYYDPAMPRECNDILMKMIEKEPEKRFTSAEEARALLIERWPEIAEENLDQTLSMMKVVSAEPSINEDPDDEL
jgi:serine/threonine protein kinase